MAPEAVVAATLGEVVAAATARLRDAGSATPLLDAQVLAAHALGNDRSWLLAHPEAVVDPGTGSTLDGWLERRAAGEPVAYIRGFKEWYGLRLATDARALIPRPETELLVDEAILALERRLEGGPSRIRAWEVATGCGAVSVALARHFRAEIQAGRVRLVASDLSREALALAAENAAALGVGRLVELVEGDLLEPASGDPGLDLVIANLPYLRSDEAASGSGSLAFEPRTALDGGSDGLDLVRRLVAGLPANLAADGLALLEVGAGQAAKVGRMVAAWAVPGRVATRRDLAGVERVVRIER